MLPRTPLGTRRFMEDSVSHLLCDLNAQFGTLLCFGRHQSTGPRMTSTPREEPARDEMVLSFVGVCGLGVASRTTPVASK